MTRKKEILPEYTVADMDLEGMPWNSRRLWDIRPGGRQYRKERPWDVKKEEQESAEENVCPEKEPLRVDEEAEAWTEEERKLIALGALKAALLIGGVFALAACLFLLFCVFVWLK